MAGYLSAVVIRKGSCRFISLGGKADQKFADSRSP